MAAKSTDNNKSRYKKGGTTEVYATRLGWWERYVYEKNKSDVEFVITQRYHLRPDQLASDVYGSPVLMWVILQYNNILDVNTEFVQGKVILLPTPARLKTELI